MAVFTTAVIYIGYGALIVFVLCILTAFATKGNKPLLSAWIGSIALTLLKFCIPLLIFTKYIYPFAHNIAPWLGWIVAIPALLFGLYTVVACIFSLLEPLFVNKSS